MLKRGNKKMHLNKMTLLVMQSYVFESEIKMDSYILRRFWKSLITEIVGPEGTLYLFLIFQMMKLRPRNKTHSKCL